MLLLTPVTAAAHATLTGTSPENGAVLDEAPGTVTLTFSEPVRLPEEGFRFVEGASSEETSLDATVLGSTVDVALPESIDEGTSILSWRVISADGHPITGVVTFSIGEPGETPDDIPLSESSSARTTTQKIVQGIGYLGLLAAGGLMLFHLNAGNASHDRRALWIAAALAIIAHGILVPIDIAVQQGTGFGDLLDIPEWWELVQRDQAISLGMIIGGLAMMLWSFPAADQSRRVIGLVGVGLVLIAPTLTGHTRAFEPTWVLMSSNIAHTVAAAIWFGGLIGLALHIRAILPQPEGPRATGVATLVSRFSAMALFAVGILVVSGLVSGWTILRDIEAFFTTTYGRLVLAKIVLAGVVCLLAAWNRWRLVPAIEASPDDGDRWVSLKRIVVAEIVVIVAIILVTGFLTHQSPTTAEATTPAPTGITRTVEFDDGMAHIVLVPGATGQNELEIELMDADGAPLEPVDPPDVQITLPANDLGPIAYPSEGTDQPGHYTAVVDIPLSGEWELEVTVRVSRFEQQRITAPLPIP